MVNQYAIVEDGIVTNIVMAKDDFALRQGWVSTSGAVSNVAVGWTYTGSTFSPLPPPKPPTQEQIADLRAEAYRAESDPLFFKAQRGEATMDEWLAKVAEIKARFPNPQP